MRANPQLVQSRVRAELGYRSAGAPGPGIGCAYGEGLVQHVLSRPDRYLARPAVVVDRQFLPAERAPPLGHPWRGQELPAFAEPFHGRDIPLFGASPRGPHLEAALVNAEAYDLRLEGLVGNSQHCSRTTGT